MELNTLQQEPYLHDRWEDQVRIEEETLEVAKERAQSRINKAQEKGDMSNLRPYRKIIDEWAEPVSEYLSEWLTKVSSQRGPKPVSMYLLQQVDPRVAAVLALKAIVRKLSEDSRLILSIAQEIGTSIEHEIQASAWMDDDKESWKSLAKHYKDRGSTAQHKKRSRVAIFNRHIAGKLGWDYWSWEERNRVGLQMIDCVVTSTKRFRVIADQRDDWRTEGIQGTRKPRARPSVLQADPELLQWLGHAMADEVLHSNVYFPTLMQPKRWEGPRSGGYWTPFVKTPFLIRFKAHQEDVRQSALDEFESLDMPEVYASVNYIQESKWAINSRVLSIVYHFWVNDLGICGIPSSRPEPEETMPPEAELDADVMKAWKRRVSDTKGRNATRLSDYLAMDRTLKISERMEQEGGFYFPHMLDFRGRMYPIPSDLSPQGGDLHRGLLRAHDDEGKTLKPEDAEWLEIHLANVWGQDKIDIPKRIDWVRERRELWERIDADPLGNMEWTEADGGDSPWQALAAVFELCAYRRDKENFKSTLPIRVDGTCNGIQHLAAMVRDVEMGKAVNLVPSDTPQDIYRNVAGDLTTLLWEYKAEGGEHSDRADRWLDRVGGTVPRTLTKRPVMVVPYGGTLHAYMTYIKEWLDEHEPVTRETDFRERGKDIAWLARRLWDSVGRHVARAMEVMEWLKATAAKAMEGKPKRALTWRTPSGFYVRQFYAKMKDVKVELKLDGQRYTFAHSEATKELDLAKFLTSIAPNFTHSMDGAALCKCIIKCVEERGITFLTAIHDSYGTIAADMWALHDALREAFIEVHSEPVLEQFQAACKAINPKGENWPEVPKMGDLDLELVNESSYFFH